MDVSTNYTANNQLILRQHVEGLANKFELISQKEVSALWKFISAYLPTTEGAGKALGEHIALTYGAQGSNMIIDIVAQHFFKPEKQAVSYFQALKNLVSRTAHTALAETLKISITPKVLPVITVISGTTGQIVLPALVGLISLVYQKVMHDPAKVKQLAKLSFDQLLTMDPSTGAYYDAFGTELAIKDMKKIFGAAAQYNLVAKLIDLCKTIDNHPAEGRKAFAKEEFRKLFNEFNIQRSDGKVIFLNGEMRGVKDEEVLKNGIKDLARVNPDKESENIKTLITQLAEKSVLPLRNLNPADLKDLDKTAVKPKKMPNVFPKEGEEAWKNFIVRAADGEYFLSQDCGEKKCGQVISKNEMKVVFKQLEKIQAAKANEKETALETLLINGQTDELVRALHLLPTSRVQEFLRTYFVTREDRKIAYLNGKLLEKEAGKKLRQAIQEIPLRGDIKGDDTRLDQLHALVTQLSEQLPQAAPNGPDWYTIKCSDDRYVLRDGKLLTERETERMLSQFQLAKPSSEEKDGLDENWVKTEWPQVLPKPSVVREHTESTATTSTTTTTTSTRDEIAAPETHLNDISDEQFYDNLNSAPRVPKQPEQTRKKEKAQFSWQ